MRQIKYGPLVYTTENSYSALSDVLGVFGGGTIRSHTEGIVAQEGKMLTIVGEVQYQYEDVFTDITSFRQVNPLIGTSDPEASSDWVLNLTEWGGTYYTIRGKWTTSILGVCYLR